MFRIDKYILIGLSVIFIIGIFAYYSDNSNIDYDYEGFIYNLKTTENGCTFVIETEGSNIRCYYSEIPKEYGYYGIKGDFSEDNTIFFVETMFSKD